MFSFMIPFFYIIDYISRYSKITEWIYFIHSEIIDELLSIKRYFIILLI
jgi:hypothetical protein